MKLKLATIALLLPCSIHTLACQNHAGFGFGSFGQFHPLAQQKINNLQPLELKVTHDKQLSVATSKDIQLQFRYIVPTEYSDAEITLTPSDNLTISAPMPLVLSKEEGVIDVVFQATGTGEHFIQVRIDATQSYWPYSKIQRIDVTAI